MFNLFIRNILSEMISACSTADKIFPYCCRHFLKWRTRTLQRLWWPTTLPAWPNSEAERSTCSSAIIVNSRRIKRTPTTRSVAQQMMSPTLLRSVSYFSLHFFLASLNLGNGCMNVTLAELTLFRSPPNSLAFFLFFYRWRYLWQISKNAKLRSNVGVNNRVVSSKITYLKYDFYFIKNWRCNNVLRPYSWREECSSRCVAPVDDGDFDASRHRLKAAGTKRGNPIDG